MQLFDADGRYLTSIGRLGRGEGQFVNPCCVTVDGDHRVWVVDPGRHDVQVFDERGLHLLTFAGKGRTDGLLVRPGGAFVREDADEVLIPDFGNRRVSVFAKDGTWLRIYGDRPEAGLRLAEVNAVFVGPDGRLLVLDTTGRTFVLDVTGRPLGTVPSSFDGLGALDMSGRAVGPTGKVYIVDLPRDRIVELQPEAPLWPASQP